MKTKLGSIAVNIVLVLSLGIAPAFASGWIGDPIINYSQDGVPKGEKDFPPTTITGGHPSSYVRTIRSSKYTHKCEGSNPVSLEKCDEKIDFPAKNRFCGYYFLQVKNDGDLNVSGMHVNGNTVYFRISGLSGTDIADAIFDVTIYSIDVPSSVPLADMSSACDIAKEVPAIHYAYSTTQ